MKDKVTIFIIVVIYSIITTPFIKNFEEKSLYSSGHRVEIAIAEDFWDYLSRFSIITE